MTNYVLRRDAATLQAAMQASVSKVVKVLVNSGDTILIETSSALDATEISSLETIVNSSSRKITEDTGGGIPT